MTGGRKSLPIELPEDAIAGFCRRWRITELALFGSALREDFGPESDLDILVSFSVLRRKQDWTCRKMTESSSGD